MRLNSIKNNYVISKHLHIVSFDVPFPPDYGGVIDVFFKMKALKDAGVKVHLHCFQYGRRESAELAKFCESVHYYPRKTKPSLLFNPLPYITVSRSSEALVDNLLKDEHPILFEGLHCCYSLDDPRLKQRKRFVRMHNIEHDYYKNLAGVERSLFRRMYFKREARKLEKFEKMLATADHVLSISRKDADDLSTRYGNVIHVPAFHGFSSVRSSPGKGDFALYHGNLEVGENNEAALFLVNEVFNGIDAKLVIAGKNPSSELQAAVANKANIEIRGNISTIDIHSLIQSAHINVLPTFQATGIKLKLLAALYNGRHCLVNTPMVLNTGLEGLCVVTDSAQVMKEEVRKLFSVPFDQGEVKRRTEILQQKFSDKENVKMLLRLL